MRPTLLIPLLLLTTAARGQDSPADRIAPYLTDDAIVVARVDVKAVSVEAALRQLEPFLALSGEDADDVRRRATGKAEELRKSGVREIFAIVSPSDFPQAGADLVVMTATEVDPSTIAHALGIPEPQAESDRTIAPVNGGVYLGSNATLAHLMERSPYRLALWDAFAAVADSPIQIVLTLSTDQRRVLREMLPDLPPDLGGLTGAQLAAGLRWAALGVSFEPKLSAKLVVQADSDQAAQALETAATAGLRRLSTNPEVLKHFPPMPLFVGSLLPKRDGSRLVVSADEAIDAAGKLFGGLVAQARQAAWRAQGMNNLKQIGLAFHNFHDAYGSFPPSAGYSGDKPLLSWRVYLLPYLEQQDLYQQFHLDEPWDSEHNRTLIDKMPEVFRSPNVKTPPGDTVFLVPTGTDLLFGGKAGTRISDITDGTSNTVLVVEATADKAVPWIKPEDLPIDPKNPFAGLTAGRERFSVLFADGSVRSVPSNADPQEFFKFLTPAGGEVADFDKIDRP
jgi:hypothetical protein